jgi:hypothetical protein
MLKTNSFKLALLGLLIALFFLFDFTVGEFNEISITRQLMGEFRSEVTPLITRTNHLIPNLNHSNDLIARRVRTDDYGLLMGPEETNKQPLTGILFLGGSTTENNEVEDSFRFPYLAAIRLNNIKGTNFKGINAGVRAHSTQESINLYINHPAPAISNAQIVVIMHNINDRLRLALFDSYKARLVEHSNFSFFGIIDGLNSTFMSIWQSLKFKSNILFLIDSAWDKFSFSEKENTVLVNERVLDQVTKITNAQLVAFTQNIKVLVSIIKANDKVPVLMTEPLGKKSEGQDIFNNAIREIAHHEKIKLIDLDEALQKRATNTPNYFLSDFIHFNDEGSIFAANVISESLSSLVTRTKVQ